MLENPVDSSVPENRRRALHAVEERTFVIARTPAAPLHVPSGDDTRLGAVFVQKRCRLQGRLARADYRDIQAGEPREVSAFGRMAYELWREPVERRWDPLEAGEPERHDGPAGPHDLSRGQGQFEGPAVASQ